MSQTTTPSGADVLAELEASARTLAHDRDHVINPALETIRTAVAALIARNAELEAERDAWKRQAERAETFAASLSSEDRALFDERNAIAAENKVLWEALSELHDIVQGVLDERPEAVAGLMDSFTLQPAAEALARTPAATTKGNDND